MKIVNLETITSGGVRFGQSMVAIVFVQNQIFSGNRKELAKVS